MTQLAEIAPSGGKPISPKSKLTADLGFDSPAFGRLALLLAEHYGVGGLSEASVGSEGNLTVEEFFCHHVLHVLGIDPPAA
ncbi:MAG TPA: hypothetical protein VLK56_07050 [Solirubrobacterales bacterium]|nr:hypothetical protein [Solirubrobacterales bacterium]